MSGPAPAVSSPTQMMVVNCWGEDAVFYDLDTLPETARITLPPQPHEIRHDPKRNLVYASLPYLDGFYDIHKNKAHDLIVIDPDMKEVVGVVDLSPNAGPHGLYLDTDRDLLWISVESDGGGVLALDLTSRKVTQRIPTGEGEGRPHWMTGTRDGRTIYTANKQSRFVSVLDTVSGSLVAQIPVPGGAEDVELSADETRLYITSRELPVLHVADTTTNQETSRIELDDLPGRVLLPKDGKLVVTFFHFPYQTPSGRAEQGRIAIVDPQTASQERTITVGMGPMDFTTSVDGSLLYVTNSRSGTMYEIGLEEFDVRRAIRTGPLGHASHGVLLL